MADLVAWVKFEAPRTFRLGTACSGSDGLILSWQAFGQALRNFASEALAFDVSHEVSCEHDDEKKKFLREMWPEMGSLIHTVRDLVGDAPESVLDEDRPHQVVIPELHHLAAGSPCDDASAENSASRSSRNRTCVASGTLRTGSVLHDLVRFLQNQQKAKQKSGCCDKPFFLILENVRALASPPGGSANPSGPSNASVVSEILRRSLNFQALVFSLDPRMFGSPQVRGRLYFLAVPGVRCSKSFTHE